jgi:hypothetical protein
LSLLGVSPSFVAPAGLVVVVFPAESGKGERTCVALVLLYNSDRFVGQTLWGLWTAVLREYLILLLVPYAQYLHISQIQRLCKAA